MVERFETEKKMNSSEIIDNEMITLVELIKSGTRNSEKLLEAVDSDIPEKIRKNLVKIAKSMVSCAKKRKEEGYAGNVYIGKKSISFFGAPTTSSRSKGFFN